MILLYFATLGHAFAPPTLVESREPRKTKFDLLVFSTAAPTPEVHDDGGLDLALYDERSQKTPSNHKEDTPVN